MTRVPKCNRIAECIAEKRCVWQGNPANKELKCMFFEQKLKKIQEQQVRVEHKADFKRIERIDARTSKLEQDRDRKVNALLSKIDKIKIAFNTKIERLKNQKEKTLLSIYGREKGGSL